MAKTWTSAQELACVMRAQAASGRNVALSPETALLICSFIEETGRPLLRGTITPFDEGSAVYRLDHHGEAVEVVAFARNALAAKAAFEYLCAYNPNESYLQKRRAWVEGERIVAKER